MWHFAKINVEICYVHLAHCCTDPLSCKRGFRALGLGDIGTFFFFFSPDKSFFNVSLRKLENASIFLKRNERFIIIFSIRKTLKTQVVMIKMLEDASIVVQNLKGFSCIRAWSYCTLFIVFLITMAFNIFPTGNRKRYLKRNKRFDNGLRWP